eukprot:3220585-Pyramimonas_sp.AAC.1
MTWGSAGARAHHAGAGAAGGVPRRGQHHPRLGRGDDPHSSDDTVLVLGDRPSWPRSHRQQRGRWQRQEEQGPPFRGDLRRGV